MEQLPAHLREEQISLRNLCPELRALPDAWIIKVASEESGHHKRIYFEKYLTGETSFAHPTLGNLPQPWILRMCSSEKGPNSTVRYFNTKTKQSKVEDPRFDSKFLIAGTQMETDPDRRISNAVIKMTVNTKLDQMYRDDIGTKNIRDKYDIIHAIDPGDGTLGAMNGGVFVVRLKGTQRLCVEKRFKKSDFPQAAEEVKMLHRLKHGSLTFYIAAFMSDPPNRIGSIYVEFCDRGSLENLMNAFQKQRKIQSPGARVPERFLWHAFGGLCDGLAYLRGGRSYISMSNDDYSKAPGWVPILHRDMKPDNVLLRSRDTLGSKRYFYCVLSDFGLACDDYPAGHPREERLQKSRGNKHSEKSDLWALGACIFNLAYLDGSHPHLDMSTLGRCPQSAWTCGTISRKKTLQVPDFYTVELEKAVKLATAWHKESRPTPLQMVREMKKYMVRSGYTTSEWQDKSEELPEWATKKHEYHARAPLDPKKFSGS